MAAVVVVVMTTEPVTFPTRFLLCPLGNFFCFPGTSEEVLCDRFFSLRGEETVASVEIDISVVVVAVAGSMV